MDLFNFSGRVAIVTGGSRGVGFAIAEGLASSGALVEIAVTNSGGTEAAAAKVRAEGLQAKLIAVDETKHNCVQEMVAQTMEEFGPFRWGHWEIVRITRVWLYCSLRGLPILSQDKRFSRMGHRSYMSPRRRGPSCLPLRNPVALLAVHDHRRFSFSITAT